MPLLDEVWAHVNESVVGSVPSDTVRNYGAIRGADKEGNVRQVVQHVRHAIQEAQGATVAEERRVDEPPPELLGHALHAPTGLAVRIEQVAGDEEELDALRDREVDGRPEGRELALALGGSDVTEVGVTRAEMHICCVQEPEHAVGLSFDFARGGPGRESRPGPGGSA